MFLDDKAPAGALPVDVLNSDGWLAKAASIEHLSVATKAVNISAVQRDALVELVRLRKRGATPEQLVRAYSCGRIEIRIILKRFFKINSRGEPILREVTR
jgi:hypothetical protein